MTYVIISELSITILTDSKLQHYSGPGFADL